MSRHNRRRVRGGCKPFRNSFQRDNYELSTLCDIGSSSLAFPAPPLQVQVRRGDLTAKHWHNRYLAWQNRDKRQREERLRLMEDRKRIFGGDSDEGDEEGLCAKMLEYFSGLDYIEG